MQVCANSQTPFQIHNNKHIDPVQVIILFAHIHFLYIFLVVKFYTFGGKTDQFHAQILTDLSHCISIYYLEGDITV
jgi:hypothetical protein